MPDKRGLLTDTEFDELLKTRAAEQWERTDSIVIGPGARDVDDGWFNTWTEFAEADELVWFNGRSTNAGKSLVNQLSERTDWAQTIHQSLVEFIAPVGMSDIETDPNDGFRTPQLFVQLLPQYMPMQVKLSDTDGIALSPASHFPSGFGTSYPVQDGAAAPSAFGGNQGDPVVTQGWKWPDPVRLAAKSLIQNIAKIDQPMRRFLAALPGPGFKQFPDGQGGTVLLPNWYIIRCTHRGPRFLQLRGARSSA